MKIDVPAIIITAIIAVLLWAVVGAVLYGAVATGPNCPGMDPSYLGWCRN